MKKKESMNAVGRVLLVLAIAALMVSCSTRGSEVEEVSAIDSNIVVHENNEIRVEFQLKNAAGQAMTMFSEGEQIVFHLSIINKTDKKNG